MVRYCWSAEQCCIDGTLCGSFDMMLEIFQTLNVKYSFEMFEHVVKYVAAPSSSAGMGFEGDRSVNWARLVANA